MPRPRSLLAGGILFALATWGAEARAQEASDPFEGSSLRDIITAIRDLESANDAKCQATATRLENFMFGTPLTEDARFEKVRLQKDLIGKLWRRAAVVASDQGRETVELSDIGPGIEAALPHSRDDQGNVAIDLGAAGTLELSATDIRQYSSVAYSLRAVLAVQQDALVPGSAPLPPASSESVDALRELIDLHTLAALSLADRDARLAAERTLSGAAFATAWSTVAATGQVAEAAPASTSAALAADDTVGTTVLEEIIAEKIAAYEAYNQIDRANAQRLFLENIERFYARYPMPGERRQNLEVQTAAQTAIVEQVDRLLSGAQAAALEDGDRVVRGPIVSRVTQELFPHEVDDLEDVTFFPRLPRERRFVLESYDMDSFRDFGMHWRLIRNTLQSRPTALEVDLDPFAAERVAEITAQLGVLIFRIAGEIASSAGVGSTLTAEDIRRASAAIPTLAQLNATVPPSARSMTLASAPGAAENAGGPFMTEATSEVGLRYRHRTSDWLSRLRRTLTVTPPTFSGGGVAAEDIDGDRRVDLLFVGGMGNALLINDGRGGFRDATEAAGLQYKRADGYYGEARQPLVADFDNDGLQDILITYANDPHRLYRNRGGGEFEDVTERAGLGGEGLIGGPATTFDFDNDGLLDIYIGYFGNYLRGDVPVRMPLLSRDGTEIESEAAEALPQTLPTLARDNTNALPNKLFRNLGGMRFEEAGSGTANTGWAQAVAHTDIDLDGRQDLVVANDFGRNAILRNLGDGRFVDAAPELGMSKAYHSMNIGIGDLNRDGYPDLYISNLNTMLKDSKYVLPSENSIMDSRLQTLATMRVTESSILYTSEAADGALREYRISDALERGASSVGWAWDADFFDFDNDGDDDLYVLNGANEYKLLQETWKWRERPEDEAKVLRLSHHDQPNIFYVNADGSLRDRSQGSGADFVGNSRSAAYLDYDEDGDLDVAINNFQSDAVFLRNQADRLGHNWIKVRLVGDPVRGSNRDAIGARLIATTPGGKRIWREVHGGSGYLSMEPKEQHFGIGDEESASLEIVWPNGERQTVPALAANGAYVIEQGKSSATAIAAPASK